MTNRDPDLLPEDRWTALRGEFTIRPGVTYLNHGSFGPPPRAVVAARRAWQDDLDANPMDFYVRRYEPLLADAAEQVGKFVGTAGKNLTFVTNATMAMNLVAASFPLGPGDEVLLNDHEYGAVFRIWQRTCGDVGARVTTATLPYPLRDPDEIVAAYRLAFNKALENRDFLAAAHKRISEEIYPMTGEETEQKIRALRTMPVEVVKFAEELRQKFGPLPK